jgi:hypothetical protein
MNLYASSLELRRVRADAVFQRVSSLIHERRDDNGINLQPLGWCREGESIPAILEGIVKIPLPNYGVGLAERVTTV